MSILQFSEHFQLIFDNSNVNNSKQIKQKIPNNISANFSSIIKFFFLILLREAIFESKFAPTNSSAFLLHTSKIFSNFGLFSIFFHTFLKLIFITKIKTMLLKQSAVLFTSCQKDIAYIMCLNT